ncbi:DUF6242 domain-containing protein [uncultured Porphyromonas sp.]|uniref:DUF6242 domain-containing protein n=1 Tax=uncultured Porphyromonas sp. TaxID=159274 RepID=UPI002601AB42|nr:DUF6242 domain-containing protein [uncultured Porphyromonas sp.]
MIRTIQSLHRYLLLAVALLPLISLPSCQRKSLVEDVQVESVLISELKMSDKALPELEKTLFSIDQRKGLIYNARPLPKGTKIGTVKLQITASPDALPKVYVGGVEQPSMSGLDTLNLSKHAEGVRIVMQHRNNASLTKEYQLKINIYDRDPYTHTWTKSAHPAPATATSEDIVLSRLVDNGEAYYYFVRTATEKHLWRASHKEPELWQEVTIPKKLDSPVVDIVEQGGGDAILCLQESGQATIYEHQGAQWSQSNAIPGRPSYLLGNLYYRGENKPLVAVKAVDGVHFNSEGGIRVPKTFPLEQNARLSLTIEHHPVALVIGGSVADTTALVYSTSNGLDWLTPHDAGVVSKIWPSDLPGAMIYEPKDQTILLAKPAARPKQAEQPAMRVYVSLDYGTIWQQLTEESILPSLYYDKGQQHQQGLALYRGDDGRIYLFGGIKGGAPTLWIGQPIRFQ